ncbi:MAG: glutathione S-transferase family protein [Myxococcales bacterium]|nr:MAG: glutathione S-transferase family protein [Myxococcales bacterium]
MKLYSGPISMFGAKAEIALAEKGIEFERELVPFSLQTSYQPKHPEVVRVNPKRQVPVLIDGDVELYDSTQIFEYLEDTHPTPPLWPREPAARARARLSELSSDEILFPYVVTLMPSNWESAGEDGLSAARTAIASYYHAREAELESREFLQGELSYADIAFFMAQFFAGFLGAPWGEGHPNLDAWRERTMSRPPVSTVALERAAYLESNGIVPPPL